MTILDDFYSDKVLDESHKYSSSGIYHGLPLETDLEVCALPYPYWE
jgi:hypothetical protein